MNPTLACVYGSPAAAGGLLPARHAGCHCVGLHYNFAVPGATIPCFIGEFRT